VVFSVVNRVMISTFQGIFGSVVKSIESDPIGLSEQLNNSCLTPSIVERWTANDISVVFSKSRRV